MNLENANIVHGDCRDLLPQLAADSIDMVLTDPPYFLDGLDDKWEKGKEIRVMEKQNVRNLTVGMNFDPKQGRQLQEFIHGIGIELLRVMKPGALAALFSQPRLAPRMAVGLEDAGFEIRDMPVWRFRGKAQFKAFSMDHFIKKLKDIDEPAKQALMRDMAGLKTIQLRPQFESVILAQKPKAGTHIENWRRYKTGLMAADAAAGGAPCTIFECEKDAKAEFNTHPTVKPVGVMRELLRLFCPPGGAVLDPFLGSGTTAVAAVLEGRRCEGFEVSDEYVRICGKRLAGLAAPEGLLQPVRK